MTVGFVAEDQVFSAFSNRRGKCSVANNLWWSFHKKQSFMLIGHGDFPIKKRWAECLWSTGIDSCVHETREAWEELGNLGDGKLQVGHCFEMKTSVQKMPEKVCLRERLLGG